MCSRQATHQYATYSRYKFIEETVNDYIHDVSEKLKAESEKFRNYVSTDHLQEALDTIMGCVYTAAQCMKIVKSKYSKQENKNQSWFDAECQTLRSQTLKALRKFRMLQTEESLRAYQHGKKVFRKSTGDKKDNM